MLKKIFSLSGFKISLLVTLLIASYYGYNKWYEHTLERSFLDIMDKKVIDVIQRSRGTVEHSDKIVIAAIDAKSVDKYGAWPWPRNIFAQMIHELETYYHVKSITLDVVFSNPDPNIKKVTKLVNEIENLIGTGQGVSSQRILKQFQEMKPKILREANNDQILGEEMKKWDNIIFGYLNYTKSDVAHRSKEELDRSSQAIQNSSYNIIRGGGAEFVEQIPMFPMDYVEVNLPVLTSEDYDMQGIFALSPDAEDGTVRRVPLVFRHREAYYPSLDLQTVKHHLSTPDNPAALQLFVDDFGTKILGAQVGNIYLPTDAIGQLMINFKGPQKTYPHYAIYDIINHTIPKEELQGKLVLVGATDKGTYDLRNTPMDSAYPGIEVHANIVDNILRQEYFYHDENIGPYNFLLILLIGMILGVALPRFSAIPGTLFTLGILVAYCTANYFAVLEMRTWTTFVYVIVAILANWFILLLYRFLIEEKDKRFIKGAFQHYLSPQVINKLMDNPDMLSLGGERKVLTAFFSDVQGFSTISESLDPEELVDLLNEYLTEMTDIIMKYEGTVDKFEGDAIIAFFGAPISQEDHAIRACMVSLEMQTKLAEMRQHWKEAGKHELFMRIGLNTGPMVVGNMGSKTRMDYTMMGDSVNLAARLEGVNKQYHTYTMVSEFTYQEVKDVVDVRELDMIRVVGKHEPVRIYEVLGKKGELSEEDLKSYKYFHKGLLLYRKQEWDEANKYFQHTIKLLPGDGPSQTYIDRCNIFKKTPPSENWDGVFQMTSK